MEKVAGVQLEDLWVTLDMTQRLVIIKALAGYQKSWMSASFQHFGALYYADDLHGCRSLDCTYTNNDGEQVNDDHYAVGPCTGRDFFDDGRGRISFDRGPCKVNSPYLDAFAHVSFRDFCRGVQVSYRASGNCLHPKASTASEVSDKPPWPRRIHSKPNEEDCSRGILSRAG